ncbi:MAG: sugar isomerase domain-containing protein [Clostridiaceae bacterium]
MKFTYIDKIKELLEVIEEKENESMEKAVEAVADAIFNKRAIFAFGASHAGILTEELFYRAGGLVVINPVFESSIMLNTTPITFTSRMERLVGYGAEIAAKTPIKRGDVIIVHSVSGRNPVTVEFALEAKKKGALIIALTNVSYSQSVTSRHPSGKRLFEIGDIVIDNHGDIGDACVELPGFEQKVGPTSTVVGATILNSIVGEAVKQLIEKGVEVPPIFYSANLDGGDDLNKKVYEAYKEAIHYQF